jgi:hypothetical protein
VPLVRVILSAPENVKVIKPEDVPTEVAVTPSEVASKVSGIPLTAFE